jgi:hypothetical protein
VFNNKGIVAPLMTAVFSGFTLKSDDLDPASTGMSQHAYAIFYKLIYLFSLFDYNQKNRLLFLLRLRRPPQPKKRREEKRREGRGS